MVIRVIEITPKLIHYQQEEDVIEFVLFGKNKKKGVKLVDTCRRETNIELMNRLSEQMKGKRVINL